MASVEHIPLRCRVAATRSIIASRVAKETRAALDQGRVVRAGPRMGADQFAIGGEGLGDQSAAFIRPWAAPGAPAVHAVAFHLHDFLVVLVQHFPAHQHQADVRLAFHRARFEHDAAHVQRVAGAYRLEPADVLQARRAEAGGVEQVGVAHHAHGQRASVPAAGDEATEQAVLAGLFG
jgi:hypothetical protein